jgi:Transglycosylase SLT domain
LPAQKSFGGHSERSEEPLLSFAVTQTRHSQPTEVRSSIAPFCDESLSRLPDSTGYLLRLLKLPLLALVILCCATAACADYVVLRSGARLDVTGYEIFPDHYVLHLKGGIATVPVSDIVAIEPEEVFDPIVEPLTDKTPFERFIRAAADKYGMDADLIHCVVAVESNFNPNAISPKNARGLMQLLPQTAAHYGVKNIFDPEENINAGTRYLKELLSKYHNLTLALAAYNAGPERVDQYGRRVPPYIETMKYVQRIAKSYAKAKSESTTAKQAS